MMVVANGSLMSVVKIGEDMMFEKLADYQAFQRPVMRVRYDSHRKRLLAGGLDGSLKLLSLESEQASGAPVLKVAYKIKLPDEVACMDVAPDGKHFALGLSTGALVIKSKIIDLNYPEGEAEDEQNEEKKLVENAIQSSFVSKAKNYKYFYRGQYSAVIPEDLMDPSTVASVSVTGQKQRAPKL